MHSVAALVAGMHVVLDSAHTPNAAAGLVHTTQELLSSLGLQSVHLILGAAKDKDHSGIVHALMKLPLSKIVCVETSIAGSSQRSLAPEVLAGIIQRQNITDEAPQLCVAAHHGESAIQAACQAACEICALRAQEEGQGTLVLVTGSTYVAAEAMQWIQTQAF
jgi:folylpolyglutamate synthase/dihydropteroate synthase